MSIAMRLNKTKNKVSQKDKATAFPSPLKVSTKTDPQTKPANKSPKKKNDL